MAIFNSYVSWSSSKLGGETAAPRSLALGGWVHWMGVSHICPCRMHGEKRIWPATFFWLNSPFFWLTSSDFGIACGVVFIILSRLIGQCGPCDPIQYGRFPMFTQFSPTMSSVNHVNHPKLELHFWICRTWWFAPPKANNLSERHGKKTRSAAKTARNRDLYAYNPANSSH